MPPARRPAVTDPLAFAIADLARRLAIDPSEVAVVARDEVTWRDGSLGCPKPGLRYTQRIVPGYRIVLAYGAHRYRYHGAQGRVPFLCENGGLRLDL